MNNGTFDGAKLSSEEKRLREFYRKLLNLAQHHEALASGKFYELRQRNDSPTGFNEKVYAYIRFTSNKRVIVLANFNRRETNLKVALPKDVLSAFRIEHKALTFVDLLSDRSYKTQNINDGLAIKMPPTSALLLEF